MDVSRLSRILLKQFNAGRQSPDQHDLTTEDFRSLAEQILLNESTHHFNDVKALHRKYGVLVHETPGLLTQRKLKERVEFLLEELIELAEAGGIDVNVDTRPRDCGCGVVTPIGKNQHIAMCRAAQPLVEVYMRADVQDLALQADALVDLVYVALGTGVMMGLPWQQLWDDVHRANMGKVRGVGKRGHAVDLVKPEGWVGPRTAEILEAAGYDPGEASERDDVPTDDELRAEFMSIPDGDSVCSMTCTTGKPCGCTRPVGHDPTYHAAFDDKNNLLARWKD